MTYSCPYCDELLEIIKSENRFYFKCKNELCAERSKDYFVGDISVNDAIDDYIQSAEKLPAPKISQEDIKNKQNAFDEIKRSFRPFDENKKSIFPIKQKIGSKKFHNSLKEIKNYEDRKKSFLSKMSFEPFIEEIIGSTEVLIADIQEFPAEVPEYENDSKLKNMINPKIIEILKENGISKLYKFQEESFYKIKEGKDVIITAPTSAGKTESFLVPVLDYLLSNSSDEVQAIFVYPTKALANNQIEKITKYTQKLGIRVEKLDGDSSSEKNNENQSERDSLLKSKPHILLTNFDFIHAHLWKKDSFSVNLNNALKNSKFLVIDEVHKYHGVFGSHVSNIISRMKRKFGSFQIIGASATLDNAENFAKQLFGLTKIELIIGKGNRGKMILFILYPGIKDGRQLSHIELMVRVFGQLIKNKHRSICFGNSRMNTEELYIGCKELGVNCKIHRAGLLKKEREEVESLLKNGEIDGVCATPTLELGIDIGEIDGVVSEFIPYPTLTQRMGRAGRGKQETSYAFLILNEKDPISRFYLEHPISYYKDNVEILIDPHNELIKKIHSIFASLDSHITQNEIDFEGNSNILKDFLYYGLLTKNQEKTAFVAIPEITDDDLASFSIRDIGSNVEIFTKEKIGDWDLPMAFEKLHPGGIYLHNGIVYRVTSFDKSNNKELKCFVKEIKEKNLRTQSSIEKSPSIDKKINEKDIFGTHITLCYLSIDKLIREYKEWDKINNNHSIKGIDDFKFGLITTGIVIDFVPLLSEIKNSPDILQNKSAVFHTFEHLLIHAGNMLAGGISSDVDGISQPEQNRIIIFDRSANGGNGACKSLFLILEEVFKRANEIVNICNCDDGCPRCIQYYQCSEFNTNLRKDSVKTLFKIILKDEKF